jgi:ankyrin repeat protein
MGNTQRNNPPPPPPEKDFGDTPLHLATSSLSRTKNLIEQGADVNAQNNLGETPLIIACKYGRSSIDIIRYLLEAGANPNITNNSRKMAIHYCLGDIELVKLLVEAGTDTNYRDRDGNTLLHLSAKREQSTQLLEYLLQVSDVNAQNNRLETPLIFSCKYIEGLDKAVLLLSAGADPNIQNDTGDTALMYCSTSLSFVEALVEAGADVNHISSLGYSIIHGATLRPHILLYLIDAGADINQVSTDFTQSTPLISAVTQGTPEGVAILLEAGADTEIEDARDNTALNYTYPNIDKLRLLVEAGADVDHPGNVEILNHRPKTLLEKVVEYDKPEWVNYLLQAGADPYRERPDGRIPLDYARNKEVVINLLTFMFILPERFEEKYGELHRIIHQAKDEAIDSLGSSHENMYDPNLGNSILGFLRR